MTKGERPGQFYTIRNPRTGVEYPPNPNRVWRFWPETMQAVIEDGLIIWPDESGGKMERPRYKTYFDPETEKPKPISSWIERPDVNDKERAAAVEEFGVSIIESGMTQEGGKLLKSMFGSQAFAYPKPLSLVRSLVRASTRETDIVLDSFAGTGTTGHATLDLNESDQQQRRCILIEHEASVASEMTRKRLALASQGYKNAQGRTVKGLGSGFRYCRLGRTLLDENGNVSGDVPFADLARYVFLLETGVPVPKRPRKDCPLLGVHRGRAVYLLYNGVLGDKRPAGGNVLTSAVLAAIPPHPEGNGPRIIYGEACRLSEATLDREGITFRHVPYALREA